MHDSPQDPMPELGPWLQFLEQHGAGLSTEEPRQVQSFAAATDSPSQFVAPLTHLGLIALNGPEASSFLHNQLTNDVENLGPAQARLAGYCSPKGRLLASMLMWRSGEDIFLQLPHTILAALQKRLQMFVLRAKVKLRNASNEQVALGLTGDAAGAVLRAWFPQLPDQPYDKQESDAGVLIRLADVDGRPRYQWITAPATAIAAWPSLSKALAPAPPQAWRRSQILAGIPDITQATQEQFVPQMVNYELIGGVNFKKGCYPGQEIVARSQYLGKLKRRMLLASVADSTAAPGMEVFAATEPDQPCGMIVNAEANGHRTDCLVELKLAALEGGSIHLGAASGPVLQFGAQPYPLPDPAS